MTRSRSVASTPFERFTSLDFGEPRARVVGLVGVKVQRAIVALGQVTGDLCALDAVLARVVMRDRADDADAHVESLVQQVLVGFVGENALLWKRDNLQVGE